MYLLGKNIFNNFNINNCKRNSKCFFLQLYVNSNVHFYCPVVAAWFLGGCASIVNPVLKPGTLAKHLAGTNIRHIFCGPCSVDVIIEGINIMNANKTEDQMEVI